MTTHRVYDLPTRVFHTLFAGCFVIAFAIGNTVDDDSLVFSYHMLAGLVLCFLLPWRFIWGLVGTRHARFTDLQLKPSALMVYVKNILSPNKTFWAGHNPASSWAAVLMCLLGLGMGISGLLMVTRGGAGELKELHELFANAFLIVVLLHIAGIAIHTVKHKDPIGKSMITGCKQHLSEHDRAVAKHTGLGVVFLLVVLGFAAFLLANFEASSRNLSLLGSQLHLGEAEHGGHERGAKRGHGHNDD
ncbi:cytochrome b [Alteromonadaceae bacterium 2753L.S.0a.02]|nr:cytochrome b [Alteromonadaceae bacterium 2753L.S.0a.02]